MICWPNCSVYSKKNLGFNFENLLCNYRTVTHIGTRKNENIDIQALLIAIQGKTKKYLADYSIC